MKLLTELFISWAPMLLLIGVWIYFSRKNGSQGQYIEHLRTYMTEDIAEKKRLNAILERIATNLESKSKVDKEGT